MVVVGATVVLVIIGLGVGEDVDLEKRVAGLFRFLLEFLSVFLCSESVRVWCVLTSCVGLDCLVLCALCQISSTLVSCDTKGLVIGKYP